MESESFSPDNSIELLSGGVTDVVLPLGGINSGHWSLSFMMKLAEGNGGYFNLLHDFSAAASNWAVQVYFSQTGAGTITAGSGLSTGGFSHPTGEWFQVQIDVDIDNDSATMLIDGNDVFVWIWSEGSTGISNVLDALNLYPAAPAGENAHYFIDDVAFNAFGMSLDELNSNVDVFPNPAESQFVIENAQFSDIQIYSTFGTLVYEVQKSENHEVIDCSGWSPGLYIYAAKNKFGFSETGKILIK